MRGFGTDGLGDAGVEDGLTWGILGFDGGGGALDPVAAAPGAGRGLRACFLGMNKTERDLF